MHREAEWKGMQRSAVQSRPKSSGAKRPARAEQSIPMRGAEQRGAESTRLAENGAVSMNMKHLE